MEVQNILKALGVEDLWSFGVCKHTTTTHYAVYSDPPYQQVDGLHYVKEDFILAILDAVLPPGNSIGDCRRGSWGNHQLVALLGYVPTYIVHQGRREGRKEREGERERERGREREREGERGRDMR